MGLLYFSIKFELNRFTYKGDLLSDTQKTGNTHTVSLTHTIKHTQTQTHIGTETDTLPIFHILPNNKIPYRVE